MAIGTPCDVNGQDLPPNSPPSPPVDPNLNRPWHPFNKRTQFELADFIFRHDEMSGGRIDKLMDIWAAHEKGTPPFASHKELYNLIDDISPEETWQCLSATHIDAAGLVDGDSSVPTWKRGTYDMWIRDPKALLQKQLSNPEMKDFIDYAPHQVFGNNHQRVWSDFMTGNWAWEQCVSLVLSFIVGHLDI